MQLLADTHVHIYPHYDLATLLNSALSRLTTSPCALFLTERADCNEFPTLLGKLNTLHGFSAEQVDECILSVKNQADGRVILIVAGSQIATAERLEVLTLVSTKRVPDRLPLTESISKVIEHGGIPVLTWAPGKWLGKRGKLISRALEHFSCEQLCLCDTSLRPFGWPEPKQFALARTNGIRILAGTDPLPTGNEESLVGSFGIAIYGEFSQTVRAGDLKKLLLGPQSKVEFIGSRPNPVSWAWRYGKFMALKG